MSLGSMFSSPGKQASQAATASGNIASGEIDKLLNYTDTHQQELRDAINKQGPNPYFSAAQQLNPQAYYTNPHDTATFSAGGLGSGLTPGSASTMSSPFLPPPPNVIMKPPPGAPGATTPPGGTPNPTPTPTPTPPHLPLPLPGPGNPGGGGTGGGYPGAYPGGWQGPRPVK